MDEAKGDFGSRSKEGIVIELRFLAYNDLPPHQFSISCTDTRNRLTAIETGWIKKVSTSALDSAFWDACYERHHHPRCFVARETYLGLVADDQIESLTTSSTEKMDEAARTAKTGMIGIENLLEKTTEELANLGFERSLDELLEAEFKHALQTDPESKDIEMSTESASLPSTRKRPPRSARVARGKRSTITARDPAVVRQQLGRVILADKTQYFPRPCTNTAARKKIAQKRGLSLGDRLARLPNPQQNMINAALLKVRLCSTPYSFAGNVTWLGNLAGLGPRETAEAYGGGQRGPSDIPQS